MSPQLHVGRSHRSESARKKKKWKRNTYKSNGRFLKSYYVCVYRNTSWNHCCKETFLQYNTRGVELFSPFSMSQRFLLYFFMRWWLACTQHTRWVLRYTVEINVLRTVLLTFALRLVVHPLLDVKRRINPKFFTFPKVFTFNIQRFLFIVYVVGGSIEKLLILQKLLDKIHNGSISQKKKKYLHFEFQLHFCLYNINTK